MCIFLMNHIVKFSLEHNYLITPRSLDEESTASVR